MGAVPALTQIAVRNGRVSADTRSSAAPLEPSALRRALVAAAAVYRKHNQITSGKTIQICEYAKNIIVEIIIIQKSLKTHCEYLLGV